MIFGILLWRKCSINEGEWWVLFKGSGEDDAVEYWMEVLQQY